MSMQPTSNAAGRDGSALRMLKLFRDRPLLVGGVRTGTIPSLLPSQKHYLKVYICDELVRSRKVLLLVIPAPYQVRGKLQRESGLFK
ncbi:MAG: hypothetical protein V1736_11325 [Pseudomonadota bacterium]